MSKAILVMDMPKSCMECPMLDGEYGECKCGGVIDDNENPTYCPLKPLPNKMSHSEIEDEYDFWEIEGWNNCIMEILDE